MKSYTDVNLCPTLHGANNELVQSSYNYCDLTNFDTSFSFKNNPWIYITWVHKNSALEGVPREERFKTREQKLDKDRSKWSNRILKDERQDGRWSSACQGKIDIRNNHLACSKLINGG